MKLNEDDRVVADLAETIASKYADVSFGDLEAREAYWQDLRQAGFSGIAIPESYGGGGAGMSVLTLIMERTSAMGYPASRLVLSQAVCAPILERSADAALRDRWLPAIAAGDSELSFGLTEISAGQNAHNIKTTARRTSGGWTISGEKSYVSGFPACDGLIIAAQTPEFGGITLFLIEDPVPRVQMTEVRLGFVNFDSTWTVYLDDVVVPEEAVIGSPGQGLRAVFDGINPERLLTAAQGVGLGRWGLSRAAEYARGRVVFDDPIGAYQGVQHPLAESYVDLEGAWLLLREAAHAVDRRDPEAGLAASTAKIAACDAGFRSLDRCLQTFGGAGYEARTRILERWLVARFYLTAPGTREMSLNHLAVKALGLPRSY